MRTLATLLILLLSGCQPPSGNAPPPSQRLSPVAAMTQVDTSGFARAIEPRTFDFPRDHGPHPDFKLEWWYFVGNLEDDTGRRFGFQLTYFRQAVVASMPERRSAWATSQFYMGHFALSDVKGGRFYSYERTSRGALGLAGAQGHLDNPFKVWIEDWTVESAGEEFLPLRMRARGGEVSLDLVLDSEKPLVLQGEAGLSRKSPEPGDASYYYSYTRMPARGTVNIEESSRNVRGSAWLDREWSTSGLDEGQAGWDWFALQLDDGRDLMVYHVRRHDGGVEPMSHGSVVSPEGDLRPLSLDDFELEVLRTWKSPTGAVYPAGWRLAVPSENLRIEVEPVLADQELDVTFRYWEGAVRVVGTGAPGETGGRGYVELVGY